MAFQDLSPSSLLEAGGVFFPRVDHPLLLIPSDFLKVWYPGLRQAEENLSQEKGPLALNKRFSVEF